MDARGRIGGPVSCLLALATAVVGASGCGGDDEPDAYGTFESPTVSVSAEASGRLTSFRVREGQRLAVGAEAAVVDTTGAALELREVRASREAARARHRRAEREIDVLRAELETAREELERDRRLHRDSAATARELNLRTREVRVLEGRLSAAEAEVTSAREEASSLAARAERTGQRLHDRRVENPRAGVVLVTYVEEGEVVRAGQPLYDVARLDTLTLSAYVTGARLHRVSPGGSVTVRYDVGEDERASRPGRVTRVADEAEFTPTPILTREERVSFVYEVEIAVPNGDGALKIGMPAEVTFPDPPDR